MTAPRTPYGCGDQGEVGAETIARLVAARNIWNPARRVSCCCGWTTVAPNLKAANRAAEVHCRTASCNQDHVVCYEEAP